MKRLSNIILLLLMFNVSQVIASDMYKPNSGDNNLDQYLLKINKNIKTTTKKNSFINMLASEFQIPVQRVEELFGHYEFNAADALMSVSIADISGQPLKNVSGLYFKNKESGWKYTLEQLNIFKGSKVFKQIKKDVSTISDE